MRKIDRDEYNKLKTACTARIDRLNNQIAAIRQTERDNQSAKKSISLAESATAESATPRELVDALIEKVLVRPGNQLEIAWKVADFAAVQ
jgi:hypothetical protein